VSTSAQRTTEELVAAAHAGQAAATGRLLSRVERGGEACRVVARVVFALGGSAYTVGVTGPPGAGKSTLTGRLVGALRARDDRVAVLAIDPTSPYSGGAILGDRVRMLDHSHDPGVFIRSMATRGHLGGLAFAAPEAVRVLDAVGFPWILLETVGVGQAELDVSRTADTTVVVLNPGWGDDVQTAKAGLLEIADIFVINKADRPGADEARADLESMLDAGSWPGADWRPPILETVASCGNGVEALLESVERHRAWLSRDGRLASERSGRLCREIESIVALRLQEQAHEVLARSGAESLRTRVEERQLDTWTAADAVLAELARL
jgi:GTPase